MEQGIEDLGLRKNVLDGTGHEDHGGSRKNTDHTLTEAGSQCLPRHAGDQTGGESGGQEHDGHNDHGQIPQERQEAGTEHQQNTGAQYGGKADKSAIHGGAGDIRGYIGSRGAAAIQTPGMVQQECHQQAVDQGKTE